MHTQTSTAVLFIRGASLETVSNVQQLGQGNRLVSHSVVCPQEWGAVKKGAEAWAWLMQRLHNQIGGCL